MFEDTLPKQKQNQQMNINEVWNFFNLHHWHCSTHNIAVVIVGRDVSEGINSCRSMHTCVNI